MEVAIALNLEADKAIHYYHEYLNLLSITEFTKVYLQIKDNPWSFVNLVKLAQSSGVREGEVLELLKIANRHLPRVRLEFDRLREEKSLLEAELNSWKATISNEVRVYQDFCDRNLNLKKREDELQLFINELEVKGTELQKIISRLEQQESELRQDNVDNSNLDPGVIPEEVISMNEVLMPPPNMPTSYHSTDTTRYSDKSEPSSRTPVFDTKEF